MKISALNSIQNKNITTQQNKKTKNSIATNNFAFSKESTNSIKNNVLTNITFGSRKKITKTDVLKEETRVRLQAIKAHSRLNNIYHIIAPQHLREAQELYELAKVDLANLTSPDIKVAKVSKNKKVITSGFVRYDSLQRPLYGADIKDNKIEKIYKYNMNGEIDAIIGIKPEKDSIEYYQKGFNPDKSYDFKITYFTKEDGTIVPDIYCEGHQKDELGFSYYHRVMLFCDDESMTYREGVDKCCSMDDPNGQFEAIEFDFKDINNFSYTKGYQKGNGIKSAKSGEYIQIKDSCLVRWNKGLEVFPDGIEIQSPRIVLNKDGKVIEYDEGYKLDSKNNYLQRHNYIKAQNGLSDEILKVLGYFNK